MENNAIAQLDFRAWIAKAYLKSTKAKKSTGSQRVFTSKVLPKVRLDEQKHYVAPLGQQVCKCTTEGRLCSPYHVKCFSPYYKK